MMTKGDKPGWRRKALKLILIVLGFVVAVLSAAVLYLFFGDLSGHRDTVADLISKAVGREVRFEGEFTPEIGLSSRVVATELVLANPSWYSEPAMVRIDRVMIEVDLWSFVSGPMRIVAVEVSGARVHLEDGGEGRVNWLFDRPERPPTEKAEPPDIVIERALVQNLSFAYRSPARELEAGLSWFTLQSNENGVIALDLAGHFEGVPVTLSGTIDGLPGLLAGGPVRHDLSGSFDEVEVSLGGSITELATLVGTDVELSASGSGLGRIARLLGVDGFEPGAFEIGAKVTPSDAGFDVDVHAVANDLEVEVEIDGLVDSLAQPARVEVEVSARGPIEGAAVLAGIEGLPEKTFDVSGRVTWQGWPITFDAVEAHVGDNTVAINGVLGVPPLMEGTSFEVRGSGPDARAIGSLAGLDVPPGRYTIGGRLERVGNSLRLQDLEAEIGRAHLSVTGVVGDPPGYEGTDLRVEARGPDLSVFRGLFRVELPSLPFEVSGELKPGDGVIALKGVEGRLGSSSVRLEGQVATSGGIVGSRVAVFAEGPDSAQAAAMFGIDGLPALHFQLSGDVGAERGGFRVDGLEASVGDLSLSADGFIATRPGMQGTEVRFEGAGPDVSFPVSLVSPFALPRLPFTVGGAVRVVGTGFELIDIAATLDDIEIAVDGLLGAGAGVDGTDATIRVRGPFLATLGEFLQQPGWPSMSFEMASGVRVSEGAVAVDEAVVDLGVLRLEASGTIVPTPGLAGTDLDFELNGDNLEATQEVLAVAGLAELPELPREHFSGTGHLTIGDGSVALDGVELTLGEAMCAIDGSIGQGPGFYGTDLCVDLHGPNASLVSALIGTSVPVAPFRVHGRVSRDASEVVFEHCVVQLGEHRAEMHGALGEPPRMAGTDLQFRAQGPGTGLLSGFDFVPRVPDKPYQVEGHFAGTPELFSAKGLSARFDASDVRGSFQVDLTGPRPAVEAQFESDVLDLKSFLPSDDQKEENEIAAPEEPPPRDPKRRVIPDTPVAIPFLDRFDAHVVWQADLLQLTASKMEDLEIGVVLRDGVLRIDPITATGNFGGKLTGDTVISTGERGLTVRSRLQADDARIQLSKNEEDPERWPTVDYDMEIDTYGRTARELAGHSNGWFGIVVGEGAADSSILDLLAMDILVELLQAFNPFAAEEGETHLDCAVIMLTLTDGVVALDPMAVQTERMTLVGDGSVDLTTERIKLDWITKPRKGLGLSASALTNSYIRLGGTLAAPSIELKPIEAAVSTGAAVATMGLTLAARGFWNRITSGRKVCKKAIEQAEGHLKVDSSTIHNVEKKR